MSEPHADEPPIDTTPMVAMGETGVSHTLRISGQTATLRQVVFFPLLGVLLGIVFTLIGGGILLRSGHPAGWFIGGIGAVCALAFVVVLLAAGSFEFDRGRGRFRVRRWGRSRDFPLDRVRAFQLINGRWYGSGNQPRFFTYQLNVVLDDPARPRVNLTNNTAWEKTWQIAHQLAEFVGVPLRDEVSNGESEEE